MNVGLDLSQEFTGDEVSAENFNLSKNACFRTLRIEPELAHLGEFPTFLKNLLSTITSTLPLDVVVLHTEHEIGYPIMNHARGMILKDNRFFKRFQLMYSDSELFKLFRETYNERNFRLVLRAEVLERAEKYALERLERLVEEEAKDGGLDYLGCRPLIVSKVSGAWWAGVYLEPVPMSHFVRKRHHLPSLIARLKEEYSR